MMSKKLIELTKKEMAKGLNFNSFSEKFEQSREEFDLSEAQAKIIKNIFTTTYYIGYVEGSSVVHDKR